MPMLAPPRPPARLSLLPALAPLLLALAPPAKADEPAFREVVRPFLDNYCVSCHGANEPKAGLDLDSIADDGAIADASARWPRVLDHLAARSMPPTKAKRYPGPGEADRVVAWIKSARAAEAKRNAGDPGIVPARRLSNAEYDNTIRDLTGVDLRPTKEFPVDPANEAGFDNSAESLATSPALVKKYLEAARRVADHVVLAPTGLAFAEDPAVADTDRDKYATRRIIAFYGRHRVDLADHFLAVWRYRHREALGHADWTVARVAAEGGISPKYLRIVVEALDDPALGETGPIAAINLLLAEIPAPGADAGANHREAWAGAIRARDFVAELRKAMVPEVKNLAARGINSGSQPLVLWKDGRLAANRRRYDPETSRPIKSEGLKAGTPAARELALPADRDRAARAFERFCSTFPDAFLISERGRVYLDPKNDAGNPGRLLSAGFHSMTGYYRDDAPLSDLVLDDAARAELDALWFEFDVLTGAPRRQYSSFLWFERAESSFMRADEFDFARAEDKDAASEAMIARLAEAYLGKARRAGANEAAQKAIADYFPTISAQIRRVDRERIAAEPRHLADLAAFAERAYRRPLTGAEREAIPGFYRSLRENSGLSHDDAIRDAIAAILISPHVGYRVDLAPESAGIHPLSDHALASRLSYFLWSSMPDAELIRLANAGELRRPEVLAAQARRMLRDDKVRGLATEFAANWLDVRRFEEHNSVDRGRFPSFDDDLRRSMFEEPIRYFADVVREGRPVRSLIEGKHTFVNATLARHYGMPAPTNPGPDGWARVDNADAFGRGGLLPMAAFLTRNAPGLRTSPVKRGYWVVRRLLGENIPPPPAAVPELPDDEAKLGELNLRETLARHRSDKSCAGCHERFDAIGLAFEGFGPVGEARKLDLGGKPVDDHATFPGGSQGSGLAGLRAYLESNRADEFDENLCRKLLAFALGRTLIPPDDEVIAAMRARLEDDGGRFSAIVEAIVASPQFRTKRVGAAAIAARGDDR